MLYNFSSSIRTGQNKVKEPLMDKELVQRIKNNPKFQELVSKRESFAWKLSIAMLVVYYTFILIIAFSPETFGMKISGVITLGIPVGVVVILIAFILTGIYVKRANTEFDALSREIQEDARRAQ